jgi:uncharacterized protein YbcC (UPF0753/DUF2309 family)
LTSYDPSIDDSQGSILERILAAAIPVCAGINLEYYFSSVDNVKYGSGSKLPHNLVSMLGVVEGATSDLRTGLYHQMVEIHEPMRLLFVIESSQEILTRMIESNEAIGRLVSGHWVHLAIIDPVDGHIERFTEHGFEPYQPEHSMLTVVERSRDWYGTSRGCRPPAMVMASRRRTVNQSGAGDER